MPTRSILKALVVALGVFVAGIAVRAAPRAAPATAAVAPTTPTYPLDAQLGPLLADRLFREAKVAIQVVDVDRGHEVWAHQADEPMVPASVSKVLTAAVALKELGPAWRFHTDLSRDATAVLEPGGVLGGNLYVVGTGDPSMVVERLWKMVVDLRNEGVVEVEGDLVFDASYMDNDWLIAGWDKPVDVANGPAYFAPLGALSVNQNVATLIVSAGGTVGGPAVVSLETPASVISVDNQVVTGKLGSRRWLRIERKLAAGGERVTFTLKGSLPLGNGVSRYYRAVGQPLPHFMAVFSAMLEREGIKVRGKAKAGVAPADAVRLVRADSVPLTDILAVTNKRSNNFMAEQVLKAIGAEVSGAPGTTAKGIEVVSKHLVRLGMAREDFTLVNGSGLSRDVRLRPSQINAVLLDMVRDPRLAPEFLASLATGGVDGTLYYRWREDEEKGRIRGKTGSLDGVYCLAGVGMAASGKRYVFTFLVNDIPGSTKQARRVQERFGSALLSATSKALSVSVPAAPAEDGDTGASDGE